MFDLYTADLSHNHNREHDHYYNEIQCMEVKMHVLHGEQDPCFATSTLFFIRTAL